MPYSHYFVWLEQVVRAAADAFKVEWTRERWYAVMQAGTGEKLP